MKGWLLLRNHGEVEPFRIKTPSYVETIHLRHSERNKSFLLEYLQCNRPLMERLYATGCKHVRVTNVSIQQYYLSGITDV